MPEVPLIDEILHSGQLAYGKYGREFEGLLSEYIGEKNLIITNTFNLAILVALSTLGITAGDAVIASPMACLASTQPLLSMGIKVKWADVDPTTGTLSPDSVRSLMHIKPKAIIHNHFCGYVGYVDEINEIGREFGIPVIDDCIEAFGSEYKGKKMGNTETDITIFSFSPVRIPNTLDGGAIIFKDNALYNKSQLVRDAGIDRNRFRDELGEINPNYDIKVIGHSATMDEVRCYIGVQQMKKVEWILEVQRKNALVWNKILLQMNDIIPLKTEHCLSNYWVYGTLTKNKKETITKFRKDGIYASGVHINNNIYSVFGDQRQLPGVNEFNSMFVALPSGWWVNEKDLV
jgi:dTDP-4-amino-4,6-dideoxygalactose transaminase